VAELPSALVADRTASRIWSRDTPLFARSGAAPSVHEAIRQRLGWLQAPAAGDHHIAPLTDFARHAHGDGLGHVYLLGMGGSSLGAEVLRDLPLARSADVRMTVLDTTDERAIREVTDALVPERSLFLVASKSGSTIEVSALEQYFWAEMTRHRGKDTGRHFVAITDPDTPLAALAADRNYREILINPPDIGGRYSVLSLFGLVPAALLGLDLAALVGGAKEMAARCRDDASDNPGLALGAFMAAEARAGRDKLTVLLPSSWRAFGGWIEQLVAESTGKDGRGVLPVVDEPLGPIEVYSVDRAFVAVLTPDADAERALAAELEAAGRAVFRITPGAAGVGAEFFRWEFATAVAGIGLGVNPFDEPNVRDAKVRTQAQLDARRASGLFRMEPPFDRREGYLRRAHRPPPSPGGQHRKYLAMLDYLPADGRRPELVRRLRVALRQSGMAVTTYGVGPRYLHSTGQYHKGGPNTGRFVLLTAADASATPVPGAEYTFSALKQAQALGDFDALVAAGRDVVHYHIEDPAADFSQTIENIIGHL
jgi:Phosphoglucose isomerase